MDDFVLIDFETQSAADLKKCGAFVYASHPTTQIICLAWSVNGEPGEIWIPDQDGPEIPADLLCAIMANYDVIAHNVGFERAIWERMMVPDYGWCVIGDEQWYDTIASCAYRAIPLALDKACKTLDLDQQKGSIPKKYFRPDKKTGEFLQVTDEMYDYCKQDVATEVALYHRLGRVSKREETVYRLDQRINRRGIKIDIEYVRQARKIVREESTPLIEEFVELTGLNPTQNVKIVGWANEMGVELPDLKKETIDDLLGTPGDADYELENLLSGDVSKKDLPVEVRRALEIRRIVGSASIKKLNSLVLCTDGDYRVRGTLQYHGASPGRWSGRLFQPHNFPRGTVKVCVGTDKLGEKRFASPDPETVVAAIKTGNHELVSSLYGTSAIEVIASSLRHAIIAEKGHTLVVGDFSTVEARIVLALSGQEDKVSFLKAGGPIYEAMAEEIYGYPVNKVDHPEERQTGKNAVLGLGFQMGWKTFRARYAEDFSEDFCQGVIDTYRQNFAPRVPAMWRGLEAAALDTVRTGKPHETHKCIYRLEDGFLSCQLPSGRKLWYFAPRMVKKAMPWDKNDIRDAWDYLSYKMGRIVRVDAYGGLLTENVVQATARDLLVSAMFRTEKYGYPIVLTVHDEEIAEVPNHMGPSADTLEEIMNETPPWAKDLNIPVASDCWVGDRYKK